MDATRQKIVRLIYTHMIAKLASGGFSQSDFFSSDVA